MKFLERYFQHGTLKRIPFLLSGESRSFFQNNIIMKDETGSLDSCYFNNFNNFIIGKYIFFSSYLEIDYRKFIMYFGIFWAPSQRNFRRYIFNTKHWKGSLFLLSGKSGSFQNNNIIMKDKTSSLNFCYFNFIIFFFFFFLLKW